MSCVLPLLLCALDDTRFEHTTFQSWLVLKEIKTVYLRLKCVIFDSSYTMKATRDTLFCALFNYTLQSHQ